MEIEKLNDLVGENCVLMEMGLLTPFKLDKVYEKGNMILADLVAIGEYTLHMNRFRENGEPFVKEWIAVSDRMKLPVTVSAKKDEVFREIRYVYFSHLVGGGVRLIFNNEYAEKLVRKDASGWDDFWEKRNIAR